jgi:hypothetical protein
VEIYYYYYLLSFIKFREVVLIRTAMSVSDLHKNGTRCMTWFILYFLQSPQNVGNKWTTSGEQKTLLTLTNIFHNWRHCHFYWFCEMYPKYALYLSVDYIKPIYHKIFYFWSRQWRNSKLNLGNNSAKWSNLQQIWRISVEGDSNKLTRVPPTPYIHRGQCALFISLCPETAMKLVRADLWCIVQCSEQ